MSPKSEKAESSASKTSSPKSVKEENTSDIVKTQEKKETESPPKSAAKEVKKEDKKPMHPFFGKYSSLYPLLANYPFNFERKKWLLVAILNFFDQTESRFFERIFLTNHCYQT